MACPLWQTSSHSSRWLNLFNFVEEVDIPVISKFMIAETSYGRRKTA